MKFAKTLVIAVLLIAAAACRHSKENEKVLPCNLECRVFTSTLSFRLIDAATKQDLVFGSSPQLKVDSIFISISDTSQLSHPIINTLGDTTNKYLLTTVIPKGNPVRTNLSLRLDFNSGVVKTLNLTTDFKTVNCCGGFADHVWLNGVEYSSQTTVVDIPVSQN
ncbi:hypothetical protein ACE38W_10385 [Chitinophaga sp. Hz27]|uniref:hypothetical protein n=1 Tax=Chitinophaga sp. Hz27 TaxID=3347169 RepID=UPI0035D5A093